MLIFTNRPPDGGLSEVRISIHPKKWGDVESEKNEKEILSNLSYRFVKKDIGNKVLLKTTIC